jgi:exopolyphosphatase/guanosine-5'-triphosphate,3'-diphosphate pyrophosphatase
MSQLALYHRRGLPKTQVYPGLLRRQDGDLVEKLAALLRLAEYLERSRTQVIQALRCRIQADRVTVECLVRGDASTELWATERKADLFRRAFRRDLALTTRPAPRSTGAGKRAAAAVSTTLAERMRELTAKPR